MGWLVRRRSESLWIYLTGKIQIKMLFVCTHAWFMLYMNKRVCWLRLKTTVLLSHWFVVSIISYYLYFNKDKSSQLNSSYFSLRLFGINVNVHEPMNRAVLVLVKSFTFWSKRRSMLTRFLFHQCFYIIANKVLF